jgi:hypothetical protein
MSKDELLKQAAELIQNAKDEDPYFYQLGLTWHELSTKWLKQFDEVSAVQTVKGNT